MLSLIVGPPGAGKSTVGRAWANGLSVSWSWLTLDARPAGPDAFWTAFVGAVQLADPTAGFDAADLLGEGPIDSDEVAEAIVEDLARRVERDGNDVVVVLIDDAQLLAPACWQGLDRILEHRSPGLHLVLISSVDPPLRLARRRGDGLLTEVHADSLPFTEHETVVLFRQHASVATAYDEAARSIHRRTEGWVAGLRLALLQLQQGTTPEALQRQFEGTDRTLRELFVDMLDRLPDDVREFLLSTSILPLLESEICNAITGRDDARQTLRELSARQLFTTPIDGLADHFRYHPLFAELLRAEAFAGRPSAERELRRQAARSYASAGRLPDAVEQALMAHNYVLAAALVTSELMSLCSAGLRIDASRWLSSIPAGALDDDLDCAVAHCGALLFLGRQEWVVRHGSLLDAAHSSRPDLLARLHLFEAIGWATQGWVDQWRRMTQQAMELRSPGVGEPFDEINDAWRSRLLSLQGQHDRAVELARSLVARPRELVGDAPAHSFLAGRLADSGDPSAIEVGTTALRIWSELGEPNLIGMVDALCVMAEHSLREGDADRAEELATTAMATTADVQTNILTVRAALALAAVETALGRADQARARLERIRERALSTRLAPLALGPLPHPRAPRRDKENRGSVPSRPAGGTLLTDREFTILQLLQSHLTFPEIGEELYISRYTVKTHVARIYRKLGVSSRSAAIGAARQRGMLP